MARAQFEIVGKINDKEVVDGLKKIERQAKNAEGGMKGMSAGAGMAGAGLAKMAGPIAAAIASFVALKAAMDKVISATFNMNSEIELAQIQFTTFMGDAQRAEKHVASLFEFAKTTPFETGPIIKASRQLQVFGGDALNTEKNLRLFGDAAAATNAPIDNLTFWIGRMYASIQAGKPFGEAAMRMQELAVMSPQARQEMEDLQAAGASADEVFAAFTTNMEQFTGSMEIQSKAWKGLTSTFKDSVDIAIAGAFKPLFDEAKRILGGINEFLSSQELAAGVERFALRLKMIPIEFLRWQIAGENIRHSFTKSLEPLKGLIAAIVGVMGGMGNVAKTLFGAIWDDFKALFEGLKNAGPDIVKNLQTAFFNLPKNLKLIFLKIIEHVQETLFNLPEKVMTLFEKVGERLKTWWESVKNFDWAGAGDKLKEAFDVDTLFNKEGKSISDQILDLEEDLKGSKIPFKNIIDIATGDVDLSKAFKEGQAEASGMILDGFENEDKRHEDALRTINEDLEERLDNLSESLDGLNETVSTTTTPVLPDPGEGTAGTGGDDGNGGEDGEKGFDWNSFATQIGTMIGGGQSGGAMNILQNAVMQQVNPMIQGFSSSIAGMFGGGPLGGLLGGGVGGFLTSGIMGLFNKKKKVEKKPQPVKVVNWDDMSGEMLKVASRRNVSPMITNPANITMSNAINQGARL